MDIQSYMHSIGRSARTASRAMAKADTSAKNHALMTIAQALERDIAGLLNANSRDVEAARATGHEAAMMGRRTRKRKSGEEEGEGLRQTAQRTGTGGA